MFTQTCEGRRGGGGVIRCNSVARGSATSGMQRSKIARRLRMATRPKLRWATNYTQRPKRHLISDRLAVAFSVPKTERKVVIERRPTHTEYRAYRPVARARRISRTARVAARQRALRNARARYVSCATPFDVAHAEFQLRSSLRRRRRNAVSDRRGTSFFAPQANAPPRGGSAENALLPQRL